MKLEELRTEHILTLQLWCSKERQLLLIVVHKLSCY